MDSAKVFIILCITGVILFLSWGITRTVLAINFTQDCGGYLKRASDANTTDQAKEQLKIALDYMEKEELTHGYTSVLWKTPDEDIGFWYKNIKSAYQELDSVKPEASQLEKTNILMKLRETLLDEGKESRVTKPAGISAYPRNGIFMLWGWISGILICIIFIVIMSDDTLFL